MLSSPLRAQEEKSLEAQVRELGRQAEELQFDLDQVRKVSDGYSNATGADG